MWEIIKYNLRKVLNKKLYNSLASTYGYSIRLFEYIFRICPIQDSIMFISFNGRGLECNPKYICEELLRRDSNFKIYWALSGNERSSCKFSKINFIKYRGIMFYYHIATTRLLISNTRMHFCWPKRGEQLYIQTWHSGIGLKKCESDVINHLSKVYVKHAMHDASITDLMISNSTWESELYRRAFWYKGEILECGLPREDIFAPDSEEAKISKCKVLEKYSLEEVQNLHLLLYVPTFRVDGGLKAYNIDYDRLVCALEKRWGGNWKIILRLHPNIQSKQTQITYGSKILNGSQYGEINDLIIASDVVISDYSSCMFDAMLAGKKVFLYASDISEYENDRGMLFRFEELPFSLSTNNDELINNINTFNEKIYMQSCQEFKEKIGLFDLGNASKAVVDWIEERLE